MFRRVGKGFQSSYRIALHFLKLPLAACDGVKALAQDIKKTIMKQNIRIRIIGYVFFLKIEMT